MPFFLEDIKKYGAPIYFLKENEVRALCGPCTSEKLNKKKIPLDGRHYECAGLVHLNNGLTLRANFQINTHTFNFLEIDSVIVFIESKNAWYYLKDDELCDVLKISKEDIFPFEWMPDIPLDYIKPAPYKMKML
jgi:hypothetical protein